MRIAIDATPLTVASGGIARYTAELSAALAAAFPDDDCWLVSDQPWKAGALPGNLHAGERPRNWITRRWWLAGLPLELQRFRIDVFHGTDFAVPYVGVIPSVMTFHDCSPWASDEAGAAGADRIRRRTPLVLRVATMVITPTESVRKQLVERFDVSPSRTVAVPLAASEVFRPRPEAETAAVLGRLHACAPYILFVGTRNRRKNLARLVDAWREAHRYHPELSLIVAGRDPDAAAAYQVLNLQAEPGLTVSGLLPDQDVAALMSGATAFVYPSLYEGFGLPVLEAMQCGAPVIVSRDAALTEVAGGAAVPVDADSVAGLARAIVELTRDPMWRRELRERGIRRSAEFSWRQTAIRTHGVYVEALRRF